MTKIEMDVDQELAEVFEKNKPMLIDQFKEFLKNFKNQASQSEDINVKYQYEDIDIQAILVSRRNQLIRENDRVFQKPVHIMAAVDNIVSSKIIYKQLEQRLKEAKDANKVGGIILIPCNLGNYHWVGILIEFQEDGKIIRAEYIDSLIKTTVIPESLQKQWKKVYKKDVLQIKNLLKQEEMVSCGVYTVENLLLSARNLNKLNKDMNSQQLRCLHLECLKNHNNEFYKTFYKKQKYNEPTVAELHQQLGYLKNEIIFSKQEIALISNIKECISNIANKRIKQAISNAFKISKKYKDHAQHLNAIRTVLQQQSKKLACADDQKNFQELVKLLFDIEHPAEIYLNLQDARLMPGLGYEAILAVFKKDISQTEIYALQDAIKKQIQDDEKLARKLQEKEWEKVAKSTLSRQRDNSEDREESAAKRARSESSERSSDDGSVKLLLHSTPARNIYGPLNISTPQSRSTRYSDASFLLSTTAITERHILLSYVLNEGKISIIINSGQRPNTAISGSQGDHITAYTALLQMICSIVDGEDVHEAPHMLYEAAKCFINDPDRLKEFDELFENKQQEVEKQFFPREIRKSLTYSLREIKKHAGNIVSSTSNPELKKAVQFLSRVGIKNSLNVDLLRDTIKHSNQVLFAQFAVEVGNQLLKDYNKEETAALPRIQVDGRDLSEGNRVKNAMKILRLFNRLVRFKQELKNTHDEDEKKSVVEDFKSICKSIIETTVPKIKYEDKFNEHFNKFLLELGLIKKSTYVSLENIENNINKIDLSKIKFEVIGKMFNDLFDFKQKSVRRTEEENDGEIVAGKIVFHRPEEVLYKVTARHINFMFIAFKNLNILNELDKQAKEKIVKGFLDWVTKDPQGNDNAQGWSNYTVFHEKKQVGLNVDLIFNKIKENSIDKVKPIKLRWR